MFDAAVDRWGRNAGRFVTPHSYSQDVHLCYVDESGSTGTDLTSVQQPVFVMAGLFVSDEKWRKTQDAVVKLLTDAFGGELPTRFELHACELLSPEGEGPFLDWGREDRNRLAYSLLDLLAERSHQVALQYVRKSTMAAAVPPKKDFGFDWKDPWDLGLAAVLTMFEEYLRSDNTGRTSTGMVLIDHEASYLDLVRERSRDRRAAGGWRRLRKVIEIGYSAVSHANPMIQLVDLVAFTMRKEAESKLGCRPEWPEEAHAFYAGCRQRVWPLARYKSLKFNKLNVPTEAAKYWLDVRR